MTTVDEQTKLLDQLQNEVNRVLEQTGRLFAAANTEGRSAAAAHAVRLKRELPGYINRYHDALDQLDEQLQLARTVMRRDLARCRDSSGEHFLKPSVNTAAEPRGSDRGRADTEATNGTSHVDATEIPDAHMSDAALDQAETVEQPEAEPANPSEGSIEQDTEAARSLEESMKRAATISTNVQQAPPASYDGIADSHSMSEVPTEGDKPADNVFELDTTAPDVQASSDATDEIAPDTANISDTRDLDSLFNDSASAGPATGDFDMGTNDAAEFDFSTFNASLDGNTADNDDSISSLLPGLQDYANTQPNTSDADLDALFTSAPSASGLDGPQHDTTFDDIMDFSNFNADDLPASGEGQARTQDDLNFDLDFT
ncbi:hypothetical protein BAUCODRAFT_155413 [Baudoinia panamericana UAMH 10762]|uniref:Uncharacterized protein n=1 Tax=Baudoinia panamericana (strain UAMH 10762) TaxID=717646 RepID=M2MNE5_BAUPA|nr:uncharacterized protein BAUCODRAFT_155413 [Baudoinia panamericana UAMH 10762]EMC98206.1 hypothetical protein BAUCODRAFT_155413 [Baudoinia panamericana UAMH 10762]